MNKAGNLSQVMDFVRAARADKAPFEIVAGGTRRTVGKPLADLPLLDISGLSGILKYEPEELILTAAPATPLAEIITVLGEKNQRLGFDPADWSGLLKSNGVATLAGAASSDASGSGKLRHGGPRDSLLGFQAVNGLGESFRGGSGIDRIRFRLGRGRRRLDVRDPDRRTDIDAPVGHFLRGEDVHVLGRRPQHAYDHHLLDAIFVEGIDDVAEGRLGENEISHVG